MIKLLPGALGSVVVQTPSRRGAFNPLSRPWTGTVSAGYDLNGKLAIEFAWINRRARLLRYGWYRQGLTNEQMAKVMVSVNNHDKNGWGRGGGWTWNWSVRDTLYAVYDTPLD